MIYFSLRPPPADTAVVRPLPRGRGRAAERAARLYGRDAPAAPDEDGEADAVAVRSERVGHGCAGLAEAGREAHFLCGCEQP